MERVVDRHMDSNEEVERYEAIAARMRQDIVKNLTILSIDTEFEWSSDNKKNMLRSKDGVFLATYDSGGTDQKVWLAIAADEEGDFDLYEVVGGDAEDPETVPLEIDDMNIETMNSLSLFNTITKSCARSRHGDALPRDVSLIPPSQRS